MKTRSRPGGLEIIWTTACEAITEGAQVLGKDQDDPSDDALERERKLVNGIRSRDPKINGAAHRAIFKAYNRPLFAILRKYSIDGDSAQDLCQLSWLTALRKIAAGEYEPQPERRLFSWLV
jgi:hypothetical protein